MAAQFDHEKLDVYQLSLEFVAWAEGLIVESKRQARETCDHLDRASLSILFNIAEGNGKRQTRTRASFFDIARGSATECAACLDAMVAKKICTSDRVKDGKALLFRIVSMLTKLVDRFWEAGLVREDHVGYVAGED
jgi:four helix bundle protein